MKQEIKNKALQLQNCKHKNDIQIEKLISNLSGLRGKQIQKCNEGFEQQQQRVAEGEHPDEHPTKLVLDGFPALNNVDDCENLADLVINIAKHLQFNLNVNDISS